jgi:hypothetical protein
MGERKPYAQARDEFLKELDELTKPKRPVAEVIEFPSTTLAKAERERQAAVAEQDRQRREHYQRLCDQTWQANLDRWAEQARENSGGFHRGYGDPDWPA